MNSYLLPTTATPEGVSFRDMLQSALVGMSGLPGNLVRPAWQVNPPPPPPASTRWISFRTTEQAGAQDAQIVMRSDEAATLERIERVELSVSVYGPEASDFAAVVRDGFYVPPNRYELRSQGVAFYGTTPIVHVPEPHGEQWLDRADFRVILDRTVQRSYRILTIADAYGVIHGHGPDPTLDSTFDTRST